MKLDRDQTKITIEEQTVEDIRFVQATPLAMSRYWSADLDGESESGETVRMSRRGKSPDDALRILFEAMSDADVTL